MRCKEARGLLADLYHGRLPEGLSARVVAHLRSCPSCFSAWEAMEEALQALGALPLLSVPPEFRPSVVARASVVRGIAPEVGRRGPFLFRLLLGLSGLLGLILVGVALWGLRGGGKPPFRARRPPVAEVASGRPFRVDREEPPTLSPRLAPPLRAKEPGWPSHAGPRLFAPKGEFFFPSSSTSPVVSVSVRPLIPKPGDEVVVEVEFSEPVEWAMFAPEGLGLSAGTTSTEGNKFSMRLLAREEEAWMGRVVVILEGIEHEWLLVLPSEIDLGAVPFTVAEAAQVVAFRVGLPLLLEGGLAGREWEGDYPPGSPLALARAVGARARRAGDAWVIELGG